MAIIDPTVRVRQIVSRALQDCTFESSRRESDAVLVLDARRSDGKHVGLRFLGLKSSEVNEEPEAGSVLKLAGVSAPGGLLRLLAPPMLRPRSQTARVRIDAGKSRLEIVCEDVEWWEEPG
jgi:hypothetical protein